MQLIGIAVLAFVVWFGFLERGGDHRISAFDPHALVMVLVGSLSAVMVGSSSKVAWKTLLLLRELVPGLKRFGAVTATMEHELEEICALWGEGKRGAAVALAEKSQFHATKVLLELLVARAPEVASVRAFSDLKHETLTEWQPAIHNWELLAKLGPSFGMVGTITGMIQMFQNMSSDNLNIGASMSLALVATLYGVAFGAGIAGPIGKLLSSLLDERLGVLDRFEKNVNELVVRSVGG